MKILVIRFSSIGDIVLTSPVIRCLRKTFPGAEIHFLTKKKFSAIMEANPHITRHHLLEEDNLGEIMATLKNENFDFIADLHNSLRSRYVRTRLKRKAATFPKLNFQKFLLTRFHLNRLPKVHVVDRYFEAVKTLGVSNDEVGLDYFIPVAEESKFVLPSGFEKGEYVAFAIGGTYPTKRLPSEKIADICRRSHRKIILLGGREDAPDGQKISVLCGKDKVYNGCGEFSLHGSALVAKHSWSVITHDTGMMHIAAALKKRVVSVWGNTVPDFGMYPYMPGAGSYMAEVEGLPCRPCSKLGYPRCPKNHFHCMELQETDVIAGKADGSG